MLYFRVRPIANVIVPLISNLEIHDGDNEKIPNKTDFGREKIVVRRKLRSARLSERRASETRSLGRSVRVVTWTVLTNYRSWKRRKEKIRYQKKKKNKIEKHDVLITNKISSWASRGHAGAAGGRKPSVGRASRTVISVRDGRPIARRKTIGNKFVRIAVEVFETPTARFCTGCAPTCGGVGVARDRAPPVRFFFQPGPF